MFRSLALSDQSKPIDAVVVCETEIEERVALGGKTVTLDSGVVRCRGCGSLLRNTEVSGFEKRGKNNAVLGEHLLINWEEPCLRSIGLDCHGVGLRTRFRVLVRIELSAT